MNKNDKMEEIDEIKMDKIVQNIWNENKLK